MIYISGPITGHPDYARTFAQAAASLRSAGHQNVYNPAEHQIPGATWAEYMRIDITFITTEATGICLLNGWENSRGATLEVDVAKALGLPIRTTNSWECTPPDPLHDSHDGQDDIPADPVFDDGGWLPDGPSAHFMLEADRIVKLVDLEPDTNTPAPNHQHKWTYVDTIPLIKECAGCGETRINHT